jgi:hypothetical protein
MPTSTLVMNNDGGWCWRTATYRSMGNVPDLPTRTLTVPPAHGHVTLDTIDSSTKRVRYAYKPEPGFAGTDHFTVHVAIVSGSFDTPFTVTVTQ